jgi:hypothetical protein
MGSPQITDADISQSLPDAIAAFPLTRKVTHCGAVFAVSPFDIYAICPVCKARLKVRAFSAGMEIEDVFDAVFTWLNQPGAKEIAQRRQQQIAEDID